MATLTETEHHPLAALNAPLCEPTFGLVLRKTGANPGLPPRAVRPRNAARNPRNRVPRRPK